MENIKKIIKENKYTAIGIVAFTFIAIVCGVLYNLMFAGSGKPLYGNRLDGIEKVQVTDTETNDLIKELKEKKYVTTASTHVSGKIINVLVEVEKGTSKSKAKSLKDEVLKAFTDDQKKFYDIQLFITNENKDAKGYPIIGYKNSTDKNFAF